MALWVQYLIGGAVVVAVSIAANLAADHLSRRRRR